MAKLEQMSDINLTVDIQVHKASTDDIEQYMRTRVSGGAIAQGNLNDYLKEKYYQNSQMVVVADMTGLEFVGQGNNLLDLRGADFSGSILHNTVFKKCDLAEAVFCDTDLNNTQFTDTILRNMDLRGADLANCRFSDNYKDWGMYDDKARDFDGIKFSTTSALGRQYADIKGPLFRKQEEQLFLKQKQQEVDAAYKQMSWTEYLSSKSDKYQNYQKLANELKEMQAGKFPEKEHIMHPSFGNVFSSVGSHFDPAYVRGSSKAERDQTKVYVPLERADVEKYLIELQTAPTLSLNDFAKQKFLQSQDNNAILDTQSQYIADCSSRGNIDINNSLDKINLSGLDFSKADLRGTNFAGANLQGCKFAEANISNATFEGADLQPLTLQSGEIQHTEFNNVIARDTNFFGTNISEVLIKGCDFQRAFMPRSKAEHANIENSQFDYANIKNGKWSQVNINETSMQCANLEGIDLSNAKLRQVKAQHAILNNAIMQGCEAVNIDLTQAMMQRANVANAKLQNACLEKVEAQGINLSEAELDNLSSLEGAQLQQAILNKINAERVNFMNANLDFAKMEYAQLSSAILDNASAKFTNLNHTVLNAAKLNQVDMTGAKLHNVEAKEAEFKQAVLKGIDAQKANFTNSNFTEADLQNSNLKNTVLEQINAHKAKININTNMAGAKTGGSKGTLLYCDKNGQVIGEKSLQEQVELSEKLEKARNASVFKRAGAWCLEGCAKLGYKAAELSGKTISSKWAKIIGAGLGIAVGVASAGVIAATGGLALPAMLAVYGGAVAAGAAVGAIGGHLARKKFGMGAVLGAAGGAYVGGVLAPSMIAAGAAVGVAADHVLQKKTGRSIGQWVAAGFTGFAKLAEKGMDKLDLSRNIKKQLDEANALAKQSAKELLHERNQDKKDIAAQIVQDKKAQLQIVHNAKMSHDQDKEQILKTVQLKKDVSDYRKIPSINEFIVPDPVQEQKKSFAKEEMARRKSSVSVNKQQQNSMGN